MKQTILAIAALLPLMATAQKTEEQYFNSVPTLTNAQIIEYHYCSYANANSNCDGIHATIDDFVSKMKAIRLELEQQQQANTIEQSKKLDTSEATKVANMSKTQQAAYAQQKANQQMAKAGMSGVDMTKLLPKEVLEGKREMTAAEKKAMQDAMMKSASARSGISMSDIAAMQNMSDEEQEAYIKEKGLANKAMTQRATTMNRDAIQAQVANAEKKVEIIENYEKTRTNYTAIFNKIQAKEGTLRVKTDAIWTTKYKANYKKISADVDKYWSLSGETPHTPAEINAAKQYKEALAKRDELLKAYYTEAVPVWISEHNALMNSIKNELLPAAREYIAAQAKSLEMAGNKAGTINSEALMCVELYLNVAENQITDFLNTEK